MYYMLGRFCSNLCILVWLYFKRTCVSQWPCLWEQPKTMSKYCKHFWGVLFLKFRNIHRKISVLESLFNKVASFKACKFIIKRLQHRCFPVKFTKYLQNPSGGYFWHLCSLKMKRSPKYQQNTSIYQQKFFAWAYFVSWIIIYHRLKFDENCRGGGGKLSPLIPYKNLKNPCKITLNVFKVPMPNLLIWKFQFPKCT